MKPKCLNGTVIPELAEEVCKGCYTDDKCVVHQEAITYLNLSANSSVNTIISTFILNQMYQDQLIADLTTRVIALENV